MARIAFIVILLGAVITVVPRTALADQRQDVEAFEHEIYSIAQLRFFKLAEDRYATLTTQDQRSLTTCRDVLVRFLTALDKGSDARDYLDISLAKTYPDGTTLARSIVERETVLVAVGVANFNVADNREIIELEVFVLVDVEGAAAVSEMKVTFKRVGAEWKISQIAL